MTKMTKQDLDKIGSASQDQTADYINVGLSSCGIAAGAQEIFDTLAGEVQKRGLKTRVGRCGCSGSCYAEPLVEVCVSGLPSVTYGKVTREIAVRIIEEHVLHGRLVNDYIVDMAVRRIDK
jgi:(2Fe-2S) ferredoxin